MMEKYNRRVKDYDTLIKSGKLKEELRKELPEYMGFFAEEVAKAYLKKRMGIKFVGKIPVGFKSGISDRMIFNNILDKLLDVVELDIKTNRAERIPSPTWEIIAIQIMNHHYFPHYDWWHERELKQELEDYEREKRERRRRKK